MSRVFDVYFNDGQDEGTDKIALPDGKFRSLLNCRLDRDARLEVRPAYASLTNVMHRSGTRFRAFDLATYRDRLIALGAIDTASYTPAYAKNLFTYINNSQSVWAPKAGSQLSPLLSVERVWQAPTGPAAAMTDIAYANGQLCVVSTDVGSAAAPTQVTTVTRIDSATGTTLDVTVFSHAFVTAQSSARVCAVGNIFILVTKESDGDMVARSFDTAATATAWSAATTLEAAADTSNNHWDLAPLGGTSDFLISYSRVAAASTRLRRYTTAFAVVNTLDIAGATSSAVIGDTTHGVLYALGGGTVNLRTCTTALAVTVGPTAVIVGGDGAHAGMAFVSTTEVSVQASATGTLGDANTLYSIRTIAAHVDSGSGTIANMPTVSKPVAIDYDNGQSETYALGVVPAGGNEGAARRFFSAALCGIDRSQFMGAGIWNYGISSDMILATSENSGGRGSIATDGEQHWVTCRVLSGDDVGIPNRRGSVQVVKLRLAKEDRRQSAEMQNALYISGGFPFAFDGAAGCSEMGFLDVPVIDSTVTQGTTGSLTQLATYTHIAMYEYVDSNGYTHRSSPSDPITTTLTGVNDELTFTISAPHSIRRAATINSAVKVVLYRNTPGDSVFFRAREAVVSRSLAAFGTVTITDDRADTTIETREVLYIYSQKPVINVAGQPCKFLAAGRDRLIFGGLPDPYAVALSQLTFPAEPVENASPNAFAFSARLPEPVTGVTAWGDQYIAFTGSAVYQIPGAGPQRNGTGEFFYPQELFTDGGCIDWRSIVSCGKGTFFQLASDKIFLLSSQGAQWVGQPIRDQLASFPVITGACLCSATQRVVFAACNTALDNGVLLIYDLRRDIWTVDNVGAVTAVAEYLGRLAYIQGGVVFLEDSAIGLSGTLPTLSVVTGSFKLFPAGGQGTLCKVAIPVTYNGDSQIEGFISYDDGKTWTSMGAQAVTAANMFNPVTGAALSAGDTATVVFTPKRREVDRFALRFDMTHATNTGGSRFHFISLEVEANEFITRQAARNQR